MPLTSKNEKETKEKEKEKGKEKEKEKEKEDKPMDCKYIKYVHFVLKLFCVRLLNIY